MNKLKTAIMAGLMLTAVGVSQAKADTIKVLTVGPNYGSLAAQAICAGAYLDCTVTHVTEATFNTYSVANMAAYDVILTQWASASSLNIAWTGRIQDYVAGGGGFILDGDYNVPDLSPLVTGGTSEGYGSYAIVASEPGLTDGITGSFSNHHVAFSSWDASILTPFITIGSTTVGLYGSYQCGRIVLTGPDQDYHGYGGNNQFKLLINEIAWAAAASGSDADGDGLCGSDDACPNDPDNDLDGDGACGDVDSCPSDPDDDADGDGACGDMDSCPNDPDNDADADGHCGDVDNCPALANADQTDSDADGIGDACDTCPYDADNDADADGVCGDVDNCPADPNSDQANNDSDDLGDICDPDDDNDGVADADDNCPLSANADQADFDGDGTGNACDLDDDGDGILDGADACPETPAGTVVNADGCSIAQLCPCNNPWKNHGAYVSCTAHASEAFVEAGLITDEEKDAIMSAAGGSSCGAKK